MLIFVLIFYSCALLAQPKETSASPDTPSQEFKAQQQLFEKNVQEKPQGFIAVSFFLLAILFVGLILDARYLIRSFREKRWFVPAQGVPLVSWGGLELFQAFLFMLSVEVFLLLFQAGVFHGLGISDPPRDFLLMINSLVRGLLTVIFILLLLQKLGQGPRDLGLTVDRFFAQVRYGIWGYIAILPVIFLTLLILAGVAHIFSYEPPPQNVVQIYLKPSSDSYLLFFTFFVAGIGPLIEEVLFRGFLYSALHRKIGSVLAMGITSLIFAAFHMNVAAFFSIFVFSLFLCRFYEKTGSLVPSMTAHVLHNFLMVGLTLGFKSAIVS